MNIMLNIGPRGNGLSPRERGHIPSRTPVCDPAEKTDFEPALAGDVLRFRKQFFNRALWHVRLNNINSGQNQSLQALQALQAYMDAEFGPPGKKEAVGVVLIVPRVGIEPTTFCLLGRCSAN